jgi:hypothetical protein
MVVGVELHCFGVRLGNGRFLDPTYYKNLRSKFTWSERTRELHNLGRRAMTTIGEES